MQVRRDFPYTVKETEHLEITMPDGVRLAARIWLPQGAGPVPALLEYLPYRKNDRTHARDAARAPYLAGHGYAYMRLDLRGCGESEGLMRDEYLSQELDDGVAAIEWIAAQDWCDGQVGMVGISWGGFNGLQVAALQPPALKAIVTLCSTDDRYADDIHYMGGTMLCEQLSWAATMFGLNTLPPDPRHVGDRWRDMWLERLDGSGLWLKNWLQHQTRDEFWKHGSICENYHDVQIPVYAVSGWADGYCRSVFRLLENLGGPCKGLVGPWAHKYPHLGAPGPAINWLDEELRWWDYWLKGRDTGIMEEPKLKLFLQDHAVPRGGYGQRDGHWLTEPDWPSPNVEPTKLYFGADGHLLQSPDAQPEQIIKLRSPVGSGMSGGKWCSYAKQGDQPVDQRTDDAGSLIFETQPLESHLDMVGDAALDLRFHADKQIALIVVRLVDVAPDGAATRVTYGLMNLAHRDSHEKPEPLVSGKDYDVRVPLKYVAQRFRQGHRLRLAISTDYFPVAWPAPEPVTLGIYPSRSSLTLPLRKIATQAAEGFSDPVAAPPMKAETIRPREFQWDIVRNTDGSGTLTVTDDDGAVRLVHNDLTTDSKCVERYHFDGADDHRPTSRIVWEHAMSRDGWQIRSLTETNFSCSAETFIIDARLRAWEGDTLVREHVWSEKIPRCFV